MRILVFNFGIASLRSQIKFKFAGIASLLFLKAADVKDTSNLSNFVNELV